MKVISKYLFENMYRNEDVICVRKKCSKIIYELFKTYTKNPNLLPNEWREKISNLETKSLKRLVGDYISGMTDRFAVNQHMELID